VAVASERVEWTRAELACLAVISVVWSKVWLTIGPVKAVAQNDVSALNLYFMNHGPWMSHVEYITNLGLVVLLLLLLVLVVPTRARRSGVARPALAE